MIGFFIAFGYGMAAWMGLVFYYSTDVSAQWRGLYGLSLVFNAIPLLVALVALESLRCLLMVNKDRECKKNG